MSDFEAFSEEIEEGIDYLEHFGILGMKWGRKNGPPYPLDEGDHSSGEKSAAKAAGVSVGSDSGKGSIANVKKKRSKTPKKELTPEEKRQVALDAAKSGDKKKITKYMNELSTEELRDAQARAQMKDQLTRKDPSEQKMSKADVDKLDAIRSGDKEKIKQYADKMSYQELQEAMNKVDLMAKLNYVAPPPTAMDKVREFSAKADNFRQAAEKAIGAYNVAAKVYNSTNKTGNKWPIIGENKPKEKTQEEKMAEALAKAMGKDVAKGVKETKQAQAEQSYKEKSDENVKNALIDYKNEKRLEKEKAKIDEKEAKKEAKKAEKEARKAEKANLNQRIDDDFDYSSIFSDSYMDSQRDVSFNTAMRDVDWQDEYDYYMRHSEV